MAHAGSIHTKRWIRFFAEKGHRVHLLSFASLEAHDIPGVTFHHLKNPLPIEMPGVSYAVNLLPNIVQIKRILNCVKPQVLHAHEAVNYGRFAAFCTFHPLIITPWGTDIFIKSKAGMQKMITCLTLKKADLITTDGENTKDTMLGMGIDGRKIAMIRFGTDTSIFRRAPSDAALKKTLHLENKKIVISLRALARSHGVINLIKAIPLILKEIPDARFLIAGGMDYDPPYARHLMKEVRSLNIARFINFVGYLTSEDLPRYLNIADVYVSTGLSDSGLSSSTAEAMACELPIITTDVADNRSWIKDGEGGFIVAKNDYKTLTMRIIEVLKDLDARDKFGSINRRAIMKDNDYETEMGKMEDLYYQLAFPSNL